MDDCNKNKTKLSENTNDVEMTSEKDFDPNVELTNARAQPEFSSIVEIHQSPQRIDAIELKTILETNKIDCKRQEEVTMEQAGELEVKANFSAVFATHPKGQEDTNVHNVGSVQSNVTDMQKRASSNLIESGESMHTGIIVSHVANEDSNNAASIATKSAVFIKKKETCRQLLVQSVSVLLTVCLITFPIVSIVVIVNMFGFGLYLFFSFFYLIGLLMSMRNLVAMYTTKRLPSAGQLPSMLIGMVLSLLSIYVVYANGLPSKEKELN